jgi:carbonic anhydrase
VAVDAIDRAAMNSRLHYLGMAARTAEPMWKLAVLTCMDARLDVHAMLGLRPGDAHVIRNAGGRATSDAIRALAISQAVLGTREVMVIHHTECAVGRFSQHELAERIARATGQAINEDFGTFTDPIEALKADVGRLRLSPHLAHREKIRGFMYELATSKLSEV